MLPEKIQQYIASYFLRSQEEIDYYRLRDIGEGFFEVPIVKRTAKRRRKTREILLNSICNMDTPELQDISKIFSKPGVKRKWSSEKGDPYIHSGALMKLISYESDEKSVKDISYIMGPALYEYVKKVEEDDWEQIDNELKTLQEKYHTFKQIPLEETIPLERTMYLSKILDLFQELISHSPEKGKDKIPEHWRQNKRLLFLHFLLAFYLQMKTKVQFDWKEIGANYYSEIGGSKMFDSVKKDFLLLLEELDFPPVTIAGLFSLGTIVTIPFSGPLIGLMSQYQFGTVHSVTDHNVFADDFTTTASNVWLVENRGVITRFASEKDFLKDTNSLVIGVEGQLKSSVKRLLTLVSQSYSVEQVLIWTDYDEAGVTIADHVYKVSMEATDLNRTYKWIVPDHPRVVKDILSYHEAIKKYLSKRRGEQEEQMEGMNEWLTWMKN